MLKEHPHQGFKEIGRELVEACRLIDNSAQYIVRIRVGGYDGRVYRTQRVQRVNVDGRAARPAVCPLENVVHSVRLDGVTGSFLEL